LSDYSSVDDIIRESVRSTSRSALRRIVWGNAASSPSVAWGGAPAEIEFGAFSP